MEFKEGERVIVNGKFGGILFNNLYGVILKDYRPASNTIDIEFDDRNPSFHSCGGKCSDCYGYSVRPHMITVISDKNYEVVEPFNFIDIIKCNPCDSDGEVGDFMSELKEEGMNIYDLINTWNGCKKFPTLIKYRGWLLENNFIKEIKKFEPLTITFNNLEELEDAYCRYNLNKKVVKIENSYNKYKVLESGETWEIIRHHLKKMKE